MKMLYLKEGLSEKVTEWLYELMFLSKFCHAENSKE